MLLRHLELVDVRSYEHAELELPAGPVALVGPNAQGKTNLLEAIHRVATGGSHRVASDAPLVRAGRDIGVIRAELSTDADRRRTVELEIGTGRRTRTRVDGQDVRRAADAVGVLRAVLFAPEDLSIVRGAPGERRSFLDRVLAQRRPSYDAALREYDRIVRQRNSLLKQARGLDGEARRTARSTLDTWTEQLLAHGAGVLAARIAGVRALAGPTERLYRDIADRPEQVGMQYEATAGEVFDGAAGDGVPDRSEMEQLLRDAQARVGDDELDRGVTLVGPHRDELVLSIGDLPARNYASHGEMWSLTLALKLAAHEVLAEVGDRPIVLLDDVFAELDETRRARLADACGGFDQVLVTAAVEEDVPLAGPRVDVVLVDGRTVLRPREPVRAGDAAVAADADDG